MGWLQIPRPSDGKFQWRAGADGSLEVLSAPRPWQVYTPPGPDAHTNGTEQWRDIATEAASVHGIPLHWILGFIAAESGGNPDAHNQTSHCYGLMQINGYVSKAGYGVDSSLLFDPATNIDTGTRILRDLKKKSADWVAICSMYNAGPSPQTGGPKVSTKNPWGYVQNEDYIDHVTMYGNFFLRGAGVPQTAPNSPTAAPAKEGGLFFLAAVAAAAYHFRKAL